MKKLILFPFFLIVAINADSDVSSKNTNNTLLFSGCNTPISRTARSCDVMYSSYKEKYKLVKGYASIFQDKSKSCTKNGIKQAKELAYDLAEEECDYKVLDFVIDHSLGLACDHIYNQKRNFMFKNEYCRKYIQ